MTDYTPYLAYLHEQERHMIQLTYDWSAVNSGTFHLEGLARMAKILADNFHWLGGEMEMIDLPPLESVNRQGEVETRPLGQALRVRKRPDAPIQVYLGGHMDTVFGKDHAFQAARFVDEKTMNAPGATDMKGGLVVMLKALEALEQTPFKDTLGWEVLINPDEEIGSPGSRSLFRASAERNHLGLIFEPCMPEGTLVSTRKGSGNFVLVIHGKAAHAGRDYGAGRNAVVALSEAIQKLNALTDQRPGLIVNCAIVEGGSTVNTVPDLALLRFNIRIDRPEDRAFAEQQLSAITAEIGERDGYSACLHGGFGRAPKPVTEGITRLQAAIEDCGRALDIPIGWQPSGGVCDGNNLAEFGLPNIDTMGVRGGNIHSDQEYLIVDSLLERSRLTALLLMRLASGELKWRKP